MLICLLLCAQLTIGHQDAHFIRSNVIQVNGSDDKHAERTPAGVVRATPAERAALHDGIVHSLIDIAGPHTAIKQGERVVLKVKIKNVSTHDYVFVVGGGVDSFRYEVLNDERKAVVLKPDSRGDVECSPCSIFVLHPGDTWTSEQSLPADYIQSMATGKYYVRAVMFDPIDKTKDGSNFVRLEINP